MPELPEVEIARRNLARWWDDKTVRDLEILDATLVRSGEPDDLVGRTVTGVVRKGKYLLVHFEGTEDVAVLHKRMTGKIVRLEGERKHTRAVFVMSDGQTFGFVDTRRLGTMDVADPAALAKMGTLSTLGPEPWPEPVSGDVLRERLRGTKRAIKTALMDQSVIAGIGNIVAAEALWVAKIDPRRAAGTLSDAELGRIGEAMCEVCSAVIAAEEADEIAYIGDPANKGAKNPFSVYKQAVCPACEGAISRKTLSGRSSWWCPSCQS